MKALILAFVLGVSSLGNAAVTSVEGPGHVVSRSSAPRGLLFVTIGGTNSRPQELLKLHNWAIQQGYDILGIDYPNHVICTTCRTRTDLTCFDRYRREVTMGDGRSEIITVTESDAIVPRMRVLLDALIKADPYWARYENRGEIDWSKIVLMGHSQGAGHAAFIAKLFPVKKVIMTGGPHDVAKHGSAPWLKVRGATEGWRHFGFLHWSDFFGVDSQVEAVRQLQGATTPVTMVLNNVPEKSTRLLMTRLAAPDPHNSFTRDEFREIWRWLLEHEGPRGDEL